MFSPYQTPRVPLNYQSTLKSLQVPILANPTPHSFADQRAKIETRNSILNPTLKKSIISDSDYNSSIYEWRKEELGPIINVVELARRNQIDPLTGQSRVHRTIKAEPFLRSLTHPADFTKEELLYIFKNLLEGHQLIFKKMKATSVSLEKSIINLEGFVKVWVNQQFERNDISGEILSKEDAVTKRIFQIICYLSIHSSTDKIEDFIKYVESSMKKSGKWTFNSLKAMVKSYCDCLKIKMAKNIQLEKRVHGRRESRPIQSSFVGKQNITFNYDRPRQRSFEFPHRNATSSLQCSRGFLEDINKPGFMDSFSHNLTSKNIYESNSSSTHRMIPLKSKHTVSITQFQPEADPILQSYIQFPEKVTSPIHENAKLLSIKQILLSKTGFAQLPEVQCEEEFSNRPSAVKQSTISDRERRLGLTIASQFSLQIDKQGNEGVKETKQSSISTNNQTSDSDYLFSFSRKIKSSNMTSISEDNRSNFSKIEGFTTASRDRFKDSTLINDNKDKKLRIGSLTNCSTNTSNTKNCTTGLSDYSRDLKVSEFCSKVIEEKEPQKQKKQEQSKNIAISINDIEIVKQDNIMTPEKNGKEMIRQMIKNPIAFLTELRSVSEIESIENTQKNSQCADSQNPSVKKPKMPIQDKILELISLNRNLVVSTYMETSSEKKIRDIDSPDKLRQRRIRDIEETLSELIQANLKQEEILEGNKWTKKLENLLGIEQEMKESISFGPEEACALLREIKMSKLGKWGRTIGSSRVGTEE